MNECGIASKIIGAISKRLLRKQQLYIIRRQFAHKRASPPAFRVLTNG